MKPHWIVAIVLLTILVIGVSKVEGIRIDQLVSNDADKIVVVDNVIIVSAQVRTYASDESYASYAINDEKVKRIVIASNYTILEWPDGRTRLIRNTPGIESIVQLEWRRPE